MQVVNWVYVELNIHQISKRRGTASPSHQHQSSLERLIFVQQLASDNQSLDL